MQSCESKYIQKTLFKCDICVLAINPSEFSRLVVKLVCHCVSEIFMKACSEFHSASFCRCWMDTHTHLLYIVHGPISAALVVSIVENEIAYLTVLVCPSDCPFKSMGNGQACWLQAGD